MILNKSNKKIVDAFTRGYRIIDGKIVSPYRSQPLKDRINAKYFVFTVDKCPVPAHRLLAFQKFGYIIFEDNVEVRHLDNNKLNNSWDNISVGLPSDNQLDRPFDELQEYAINASKNIRKFTDAEMEEIRKFHRGSYKETMEIFSISSKGTLHRILNVKYITKV